MTFREDAEGPRDRAERLDRDVQDAERALREARERRLADLEHQIASARHQLDEMHQAMHRLRGEGASGPVRTQGGERGVPPATPRAFSALLPLGLIGLLGLSLAVSSSQRCRSRARSSMMHAATTQGAAAGFGTPTRSPGDAPTTRQVSLRWSGHVKRASGTSLVPGTTCRLEAEVDGNGVAVTGDDISLRCGDRVIYRHVDRSGEHFAKVEEHAGPTPGTFAYTLRLEDGERESFDRRSMASIDTEARELTIWRAGASPLRVDLELDARTAETHDQRAPFFARSAATTALHGLDAQVFATQVGFGGRTAHVAQTSGAAPVSIGTRCSVDVIQASPSSAWSCRAFVRCGGKLLFGERGTGYASCTIEGASLRVRDRGATLEDGDPSLDADMGAGKLTLSDDDGQPWSLSIVLDD